MPCPKKAHALRPYKERAPMGYRGRNKPSMAMETFDLIPADPATVRKVLLEDLYET